MMLAQIGASFLYLWENFIPDWANLVRVNMSTLEEQDSDLVHRDQSIIQRVLNRREFGVAVAILGLIVLGGIVNSEVFFRPRNFIGLLRNAATVSIIGYGMSMLMTSGEFDLSVGSLSAVAAGLVAVMISSGYSPAFAIFLALSVALIYGLTQGIIITKIGLPSLIITIGSLTLLRGVHFIITGNQSQGLRADEGFNLISILGGVFTIPGLGIDFPMQIAWLLLLGVTLHYVLFHTRFGYHTRFTGASTKSAEYMKIPVDEVKILNFALVAVLAAFAGIGQAVWAGSVSPGTGSGLELIVIAAVVIGGTDLFGGEGTIAGVVLGALVFSLTQNILVLAGLGARMFSVFTGVFIIGAVFIEQVATASFREILVEDYLKKVRRISLSPQSFFGTQKLAIGPASRENTLDIDEPIQFLVLNWLAASLVAVVVINAAHALTPLDFSLFIIKPGIGSLVTIPLVLFMTMTFLFLLTVAGASLGSRFTDRSMGMFDAVPIVSYSFLPFLLLFIPLALVGFEFLVPLIAVGALLVAVPVLLLLFVGAKEALSADLRGSIAVVGVAGVLLVVVAMYIALSL